MEAGQSALDAIYPGNKAYDNTATTVDGASWEIKGVACVFRTDIDSPPGQNAAVVAAYPVRDNETLAQSVWEKSSIHTILPGKNCYEHPEPYNFFFN